MKLSSLCQTKFHQFISIISSLAKHELIAETYANFTKFHMRAHALCTSFAYASRFASHGRLHCHQSWCDFKEHAVWVSYIFSSVVVNPGNAGYLRRFLYHLLLTLSPQCRRWTWSRRWLSRLSCQLVSWLEIMHHRCEQLCPA